MKNEYKYYEFDPGQAAVFLLNETLGKLKLKAVSCFLTPTNQNPNIFSYLEGVFKKVDNKKPFHLPNREQFDNKKIKIQKIENIPQAIQAILKPQKTLMDVSNINNYIITLRFYNIIDGNWDYLYILIDKSLQESIKTKLATASLKTESENETFPLINSYFKLSYSFIEEFIKIEFKKYQFIREMASTLEKTISIKNHLENRIEELKKTQKSDLIDKINLILKNESDSLESTIQLSPKALDFIFEYEGDENILLQAISKAADFTKNLNALKSNEKLEIDINYIQIYLEHKNGMVEGSNDKRIEKAELFLDKYEAAALIAQNRIKKVNIFTIASNTQPRSVKPPAVSANIKKYKDEMRYLLEANQSKWTVLRTMFSPIYSMVNKKPIRG